LNNIIKTLIGSIIKLIPALLILFKNYKKIKKNRKIIIHLGDGYGDHFTHHDLARYYYKNKTYLYIHFFEIDRHNKKLCKIFNDESFYFLNNFKIKLFNKTFFFGETETSKIKPLFSLLTFLIKIILPKKNEILFYPYIYNKINKTYEKLNLSTKLVNPDNENLKKDWVDYYYKIINKYKKSGLFIFDKKVFQSKFIINKKIAVVYLRKRYSIKESANTNTFRSGYDDLSEYINSINLLINKNYFVFLMGDHTKNLESLNNLKFFINTQDIKNVEDREKTEMFALINANLMVGEHGGVLYHGLYINKTLCINYFPTKYPFPAKKLCKKIMDTKQKNYLNLEKLKDSTEEVKILKKNNSLKLLNNSSEEMFNFVKDNIG
jgi:hypothetical protein